MGFHSLEIGKSALMAANYGLQVTGQNASNVNTAGYSRQVVSQTGANGVRAGAHMVGSGVNIISITNVTSIAANRQVRQATSNSNYADTMNSAYGTLQTNFSALTDSSLSADMSKFFNSLSELSSHLETLSNRTTVLEDAGTLSEHLNVIANQLRQNRIEADDAVKTGVEDINKLVDEIASLNAAIVKGESGGLSASTASDLRDRRTEALRKLSGLVNIEVTEETNGSTIVTMNGRQLVYYNQSHPVDIKYQQNGDMTVAIPVFSSDGYPLNPSSGSLAAQMEIRDEVIKGYMEELDSLAGAFTWEFNRIYSQTRGTEPFGSMVSTNSPTDPAVPLNQLEFKQAKVDGTFQIVNGNLEFIVYNKNTGQETTVPIEIDLDGRQGGNGEPDMILWDPANPEASHSFINRLQSALNDSFPGAFEVSIDNEYKVHIESLSEDYGFCFGADSSGILAALGLNTFFTGYSAADIGVNPALEGNPQLMGVATTWAAGDNSGVNSLYDFRETSIDRLGGQNVDSYYLSLIGRLGSEALAAKNAQALKSDILLQVSNSRESISGVNEDEESMKLIIYQRAYQSAARFISVVDEMYETLINM